MKPERKRRLLLVLGSVFAVAAGLALVLYAMRQNINFFYTPTQIVKGEALQQAGLERTINIGGLVVKGSVKRDPSSLKVQFKLSDTESEVTVFYEGILPDLFREGQGIIGVGKLNADSTVQASQILAKHDENYMSPEVASAIKDAEARAKAKLQQERAAGAAAYESQPDALPPVEPTTGSAIDSRTDPTADPTTTGTTP
ncbi:cytochrome c maturation protein CcmE [Permianibacter sp. IMCC34836]|nr:cytochrome c maturation protein CcmE [Permianibacter fluminis]NQD38216.1 cytochrome c maturation protein CcmE [Permianibacter fluminis]